MPPTGKTGLSGTRVRLVDIGPVAGGDTPFQSFVRGSMDITKQVDCRSLNYCLCKMIPLRDAFGASSILPLAGSSVGIQRRHKISPAAAKALVKIIHQVRHKEVGSTIAQFAGEFGHLLLWDTGNHEGSPGLTVMIVSEPLLDFISLKSLKRFF